MRKVLYAIGVLVIVFIGSIIVGPFLIPTDKIKNEVTQQASKSLGRDVTVNGPVHWSVFPHLRLEASNVTISNVPKGYAKNMAQLGKLAIDLELLPLLSGNVILNRLELIDPVLNFEVDAQGHPNWDFDEGKGAKPATPKPTPSPSPAPQTASSSGSSIQLDQLRLDDIRLENGTINYLDQRTNEKRTVSAINATVSLPALDKKLSFDGSLVWNAKKIALALGVDNPRAFAEGAGSALSVSLQGDPITAGFKGTGGLKPATKLTGDVDLKIPSIRGLADWAGSPMKGGSPDTMGLLAITGKLALAGNVTSFTDATFQLDKINATIKQLSVDSAGARPSIKGDLTIQQLDLDPYMASAADGKPAAAPAAPAAPSQPAAGGSKEWSDAPIDVSGLKQADLNLTLVMAGLNVQKIAVGQSSAAVQLKDGKLTAVLNQMALYQGTGTGQVVLDGSGAVPSLQLALKLANIAVQPFLKDAVAIDKLSGTGSFDLDITGKGKSQREIIGSLDGKGSANVANGAIQGVDLAAMAKNVETAFAQAVAGGAQKTDFASLAGTFTVASGVIKNQDLDLKSPAFEVAGAGTVDLPRRQIDYRLTPKNASGGNVAVPILVQGPLDNPSYKPDLAGILQQGISNPAQLLKSLKGGGNQPSTGQQQPTSNNPANALKGLLGGH